jgi:hypothetical protein
MRNLISLFGLVLFLAGFSAAQTASGVSQLVPYPGTYASPYVPQVSTPEVQFATPTLQVGATNATSGNLAGAANSTTETLTSSPEGTAELDLSSGGSRGETSSLELGGAVFEDSVGVATLMGEHKRQGHASRTYTNADIERLKSAENSTR